MTSGKPNTNIDIAVLNGVCNLLFTSSDNCIMLVQDQGPHIYQTCPSANYFDCKAMAVGSRSQSARTYLEKHLDVFPGCDLEELIKHGLRALRDTLPNELDLNTKVRCLFY